MAPFALGSQSEPFSLMIDSGSGTLAVAAAECADCDVGAPTYTPGGGAKNLSRPVNLYYGDGSSLSGTAFRDTVTPLAPHGRNATVPVPMRFAAVTEHGGFFRAGVCEANSTFPTAHGIVGLGPGDLSEPGTDNFITRMAEAADIPRAHAVQLCDRGGTLWLGGYDPASLAEPMTYLPMVKSEFVAIEVSGFGLGGQLLANASDLGPVVVDSGSSLFSLPTGVLKASMGTLFNNTYYANVFQNMSEHVMGVPCGAPAVPVTRKELDERLPALTLEVPTTEGRGHTLHLLPTHSYLFPLPDGRGGPTMYCVMLYDGGNETILGNTAMRSQVILFDQDQRRLGIAPARRSACSASPGASEAPNNASAPAVPDVSGTVDVPSGARPRAGGAAARLAGVMAGASLSFQLL
ncbi:MAG TPA: pepsin-like aspartic protease [Myxococcota bacterium]|nr:pepsin-like aspartic protease [Myxococcota bacterium]